MTIRVFVKEFITATLKRWSDEHGMFASVDHFMSRDRYLNAIPAASSKMIICGPRDHFHLS